MHKVLALFTTVLLLFACEQQGTDGNAQKTSLNNQKEMISYALGKDMGAGLARMEADVDIAALMQGLKDTLEGKPGLMSQDSGRKLLIEWTQSRQAEMQQKVKAEAEVNQKKSNEFLAANKEKEGVQTTESGLQYKVLQAGTGKNPTKEDQVKVHYEGKNLEGKVFDSSRKRGEPLTMSVTQVIPGWQEALQLMKPGAKWQVWVPPTLGYGERKMSPEVGPNAVLEFEIELLDIVTDSIPTLGSLQSPATQK